MRKYTSEFGLNVYARYKTIISPAELEALEKVDHHKYHIYGILLVPKFFIKEGSVTKHKDHISLVVFTNAFDKYSEYTVRFCLDDTFDHECVRCETTYPHSTLKLHIENEEWCVRNSWRREVKIPAMHLFESNASILMPEIQYKVLYIGQSYGKRGERSAIKRLSSHETLQKILIDTQRDYPEYEIKIMLLEMAYRLGMAIEPTAKVLTTEDEDSIHTEKVLSNLPQEQQVINITEAALINYFRPQYNIMFVENFPCEKHRSYRQYFDLDYNDLVIEIDMEFENFPYIVLYSDQAQISSPWDYIHYQLDNTNERESMYSIFRK